MLFVVGDDFFALLTLEEVAGNFLVGEVAGDGEDLAVKVPPVGVDALAVLKERLEHAVGDDRQRVAQRDQLLIIMEDGIRVRHRGLRVDLLVVGVHRNPRLAGREARVLRIVPLYRRAGVVAAHLVKVGEHGRPVHDLFLDDVLLIGVDRLNVIKVVGRREMRIGHAEFFALVDVRRALHQVQAGCEHLRGENAPLGGVVAEAGDRAGLVVVVPVERIPGLPLQLGLPFVEGLAKLRKVRLLRRPFAAESAGDGFDMLKMENHAELRALGIGIFLGFVHGHAGRLADGQKVILRKDAAVHLLQVLVDTRAVVDVGAVEAQVADRVLTVRETLVLGDHADDVHAEAVDALLAPPGHHVEDLVADLRVLPVKIRLLLREEVEIVLAGLLVILPGRAGEAGFPVVRFFAVARILPDVEVALGVVPGAPALDEPGMLVGGVVHHKVHDDLEAEAVCGREHLVEVFHRAEFGHDIAVIGDVVAVVVVGGFVDGREPDHVRAELLNIRKSCGDARKVADAVAVRILKASGINLINDGFLPPKPLFLCHVFLLSKQVFYAGCGPPDVGPLINNMRNLNAKVKTNFNEKSAK